MKQPKQQTNGSISFRPSDVEQSFQLIAMESVAQLSQSQRPPSQQQQQGREGDGSVSIAKVVGLPPLGEDHVGSDGDGNSAVDYNFEGGVGGVGQNYTAKVFLKLGTSPTTAGNTETSLWSQEMFTFAPPPHQQAPPAGYVDDLNFDLTVTVISAPKPSPTPKPTPAGPGPSPSPPPPRPGPGPRRKSLFQQIALPCGGAAFVCLVSLSLWWGCCRKKSGVLVKHGLCGFEPYDDEEEQDRLRREKHRQDLFLGRGSSSGAGQGSNSTKVQRVLQILHQDKSCGVMCMHSSTHPGDPEAV
jgi:hypothetical protein